MENQSEEKEEKPIVSVLFGLAMFAVAYYCYYTFTKYENGEGITMNRILMLLYGIGGKWVPIGLTSLLGLYSLFSGVKKMTGK
ncbi:MAG: hypothetical protein RLZZ546_3195 [Bacteroidota bacterium]|jgi:hypothetical protein